MANITYVDGDQSLGNRVMAAWLNDVGNGVYAAESGLAVSASLIARTSLNRGADWFSALDVMTDAERAVVRAYSYAIDVTAKLQAAVAYCVANGYNLWLPKGGYLISGTFAALTLAAMGLTIRGDGFGTRILNKAPAGTPFIRMTGVRYIRLENFCLLGHIDFPNNGIAIDVDVPGVDRSGYIWLVDMVLNPNGVGVDVQDTNTIWIINPQYWSGESSFLGASGTQSNLLHAVHGHGVGAVNAIYIENPSVGAIATVAEGGAVFKFSCATALGAVVISNNIVISNGAAEQAAMDTYRSIYFENVYGFSIDDLYIENSNALMINSRFGHLHPWGSTTWKLTLGDGTVPGGCAYISVVDTAISAIVADSNNTRITCQSVVSNTAWSSNASTFSARINCVDNSGALPDKLGSPNGIIERDRTVAMGVFITPTFSAGNFTGSGSLTVTVAAGDVSTNEYALTGTQITWNLRLAGVSTGGTASTAIKCKIPGGLIAAKTIAIPCIINNAGGGAVTTGIAEVVATETFVNVYVNATQVTNWSNGAVDNTALQFSFTFDVG